MTLLVPESGTLTFSITRGVTLITLSVVAYGCVCCAYILVRSVYVAWTKTLVIRFCALVKPHYDPKMFPYLIPPS